MNKIASIYRYWVSYIGDMTYVERLVALRHVAVLLILCFMSYMCVAMLDELRIIKAEVCYGSIRIQGNVDVSNEVQVKNADNSRLSVEIAGVRQGR